MSGEFVFGVDIDGVLADHTGAFRQIVARLQDRPLESLPLDRSWDFREWGFAPGDYEAMHRVAVLEHHMFRDMDPMEGAAEALWRLSDSGVWIRIITHRLYVNWGHQRAVSDTVAWLDTNQIPYRDICFLGAKPEVEADCYIDDAPHNIRSLRDHGNTVIVFDQPYNREFDGLRAASWEEVESVVLALVAEAQGAVEVQFPGIDAGTDRLTRRLEG